MHFSGVSTFLLDWRLEDCHGNRHPTCAALSLILFLINETSQLVDWNWSDGQATFLSAESWNVFYRVTSSSRHEKVITMFGEFFSLFCAVASRPDVFYSTTGHFVVSLSTLNFQFQGKTLSTTLTRDTTDELDSCERNVKIFWVEVCFYNKFKLR